MRMKTSPIKESRDLTNRSYVTKRLAVISTNKNLHGMTSRPKSPTTYGEAMGL